MFLYIYNDFVVYLIFICSFLCVNFSLEKSARKNGLHSDEIEKIPMSA